MWAFTEEVRETVWGGVAENALGRVSQIAGRGTLGCDCERLSVEFAVENFKRVAEVGGQRRGLRGGRGVLRVGAIERLEYCGC